MHGVYFPRSTESRSPASHVLTVLTSHSRPISHFPTYDEIPDAVVRPDNTLDSDRYEPLRQQRYSAYPPPSPPARDADKPPPPPVKPKPRAQPRASDDSINDNNYLRITPDDD